MITQEINFYNPDAITKIAATVAQTVDSTTRTTTSTYDRQGNQTVIQHPDGSKQEFTFGTAGRISAVGWRDSGNTLHSLVSSVTYAPHGAVDTITYANGVSTSYDYAENELYRLHNKTTTLSSTQFQDFTYTYDPTGNITAIVDAPTIYAQVDHAMTYDDLHRLTQAAATSTDGNLSGTRNYTYGILGNILTSPIGTYLYQSTNANIFSNPHAVTKIGNTVIAYDKNGNMTSDGTFTNTWDFKNRLVTSAKTGNTITYRYDYTGNRVKKTDTTSGTPTYYVDSTYELEGTKTRHHISAPGIGTIATVTTTSTTTDYAYHHTDHLGGTHVETDASGNLLQYMVYEPFGKIRYNYKSGSYGNDYTFTGKELDSETNLQYFGARYYAPTAGRFTSSDPIFLALGSGKLAGLQDPQVLNSYAYGRNNPYRMVDPDGNFPHEIKQQLFGLRHPLIGLRIGPYLQNSSNISSTAGHFAVNAFHRSSSNGGYNALGSRENAFRHVLWQAIITVEYGADIALSVGNAHENNPNTDLSIRSFAGTGENVWESADQSIDLLNNRIGRAIGMAKDGVSRKDLAFTALDFFHEFGLYVGIADSDGVDVVQQRLSDSEYQDIHQTFEQKGENGLNQE